MSYHRLAGLGMPAPFTPTAAYAQAVSPYVQTHRPGALYAPYGWGPGFNVGMPFNYTHHIDYVPAASGCGACGMAGSWSGSQPGYATVSPSGSLAGILAVM